MLEFPIKRTIIIDDSKKKKGRKKKGDGEKTVIRGTVNLPKKEPLKIVYPTDGVINVPSPIAIFKETKNPEGAKALVDWWLSKEGQEAVVKGWMHSVRGDVKAPTGAEETKKIVEGRIKVDWQKLANNNAQIKEEFRKRVMDK